MNIIGDTVIFSDENDNELIIGGYSGNVLSIFDIRKNTPIKKLFNDNFHVLSISHFFDNKKFGSLIALCCSKINQLKIYSYERNGNLTNIDTLFNIPNPVFSSHISNNYISYCCAKESFTLLKHKYK